jgi:hypothetical protein
LTLFNKIILNFILYTHFGYTCSNFPKTECVMDLRGWEFLWKIFAAIGIANLLLFFVIVFVNEIYNSKPIWILIAIESAYYLDVLIVRQLLR